VCGKKTITQLLGVEYDGYYGRQARAWWNRRDTGYSMPTTNTAALKVIEQLKTPTHIKVITNRKYPEVLEECFDGSAFGMQEPDDTQVEVSVVKVAPMIHLERQLKNLA
jgi:hypothetical protein